VTRQIIMIIHTVLAGSAFLAFSSLCFFHMYLQSIGKGTYDWVLTKRSPPQPRAAQPVRRQNTGTNSELARPDPTPPLALSHPCGERLSARSLTAYRCPALCMAGGTSC
jgi:hypothetical protein